jgi:hypothetical protein
MIPISEWVASDVGTNHSDFGNGLLPMSERIIPMPEWAASDVGKIFPTPAVKLAECYLA